MTEIISENTAAEIKSDINPMLNENAPINRSTRPTLER
ncbi:hypothetical protein BN130_1034 [Cronobacter malonaticus 507]|nr:hypothetical protein BN130_1034 [Cronobacter malonaticus 507]